MYIQGVSKVTLDFIQLKSQWIFFYDIFYIYAFSNHFYCYVAILCSYTTYQKYKFVQARFFILKIGRDF